MTTMPYPITKVLIPYDGSPSARNALELAAHLALAGREAVKKITLLQVTGGSYVARHVHNVDLRVTRMDQVKEWRRVRQHYLEREVLPVLEDGKRFLEAQGVAAPLEGRVAEGKVADEIIRLAREEGFSTIIMGRRGLSPLKALFLGSVTRSVLSLAEGLTVYVAGQEPIPRSGCPISPLLLPVDGSEYSLAAIRQAAALAQAFQADEPQMTLFHVVDIALLEPYLLEGSDRLVAEGESILAASRRVLQEAGLEGRWTEKLTSGQPAQVIVQEAEAGGYPLIMMGSKGRTGLEKLLLGSVASNVVHHLPRPAVAVVYP